MRAWAELSGDNVDLARRELSALLRLEGVEDAPLEELPWGTRLWSFETGDVRALAARLAYTHRLLRPLGTGTSTVLRKAARDAGSEGGSAAVRSSSGSLRAANLIVPLGRAFVEGGGSIDLEAPSRSLVVFPSRQNPEEFALAEEAALTARLALQQRPPRTLPFRKPVTLSPLLARALVNLCEVPPGGRLLDPFCGTGAILVEGGQVGCRLIAADVDGRMVRGALANLALFGLTPEKAIQADVGQLGDRLEGHLPIDGVATDPPYGRASTTKGEEAGKLLRRALEALPSLVKRGGRMVTMVPQPRMMADLPGGWSVEGDPVPMRAHRSLTRWVFVLRN